MESQLELSKMLSDKQKKLRKQSTSLFLVRFCRFIMKRCLTCLILQKLRKLVGCKGSKTDLELDGTRMTSFRSRTCLCLSAMMLSTVFSTTTRESKTRLWPPTTSIMLLLDLTVFFRLTSR
jgi:hypothetical protein